MEKKLPNNWIVTEIGNICLIGDGNHSGKYPKKEEMLSEGIPFIRGVNFKKGIVSTKYVIYLIFIGVRAFGQQIGYKKHLKRIN
ncbi:hypothetical protein ACFPH8_05510 [Bizionia hallyeonensis]|uniref:Type I restriction enzyme, S subunit n=1 Tax=Bizionia hallyeonensis TaxID=1123757 RepID=A0ABW0C4F0_9FLAO